MFWDGERWIPEPGPAGAAGTTPPVRRGAFATLAALLLASALAAQVLPADAAIYHPRVAVTGVPAPGSNLTLTGTDFRPGGTVRIGWDRDLAILGYVGPDDGGRFVATIQVPSTALVGMHTLTIARASDGPAPVAAAGVQLESIREAVVSLRIRVVASIASATGPPSEAPSPAEVVAPLVTASPTTVSTG